MFRCPPPSRISHTVHSHKLGFSSVSRVNMVSRDRVRVRVRARIRVRFSFSGYLCPMRELVIPVIRDAPIIIR